jgi:hypothetical protein
MLMLDTQVLLEVLKAELAFLENGGYRERPRYPWRPNFVFEDSPTCLNFKNSSSPEPCVKCALMAFVPKGQQHAKFPCRRIPITAMGETVSSFYESGTQQELETALRDWLRQSIQMLEGQNKSLGQVA